MQMNTIHLNYTNKVVWVSKWSRYKRQKNVLKAINAESVNMTSSAIFSRGMVNNILVLNSLYQFWYTMYPLSYWFSYILWPLLNPPYFCFLYLGKGSMWPNTQYCLTSAYKMLPNTQYCPTSAIASYSLWRLPQQKIL